MCKVDRISYSVHCKMSSTGVVYLVKGILK